MGRAVNSTCSLPHTDTNTDVPFKHPSAQRALVVAGQGLCLERVVGISGRIQTMGQSPRGSRGRGGDEQLTVVNTDVPNQESHMRAYATPSTRGSDYRKG